jgi:hypothetical protein
VPARLPATGRRRLTTALAYKSSKNPELAFALVKHLTSVKWATRLAQIRRVLTANIEADNAVPDSVKADDPFAYAVLQTQLEHTDKIPATGLWQMMRRSRRRSGRNSRTQASGARTQRRHSPTPNGASPGSFAGHRPNHRYDAGCGTMANGGALMSAAAMDTSIHRPRFAERRSTRKALLIRSFLAPSLLIFLHYRIPPLGWNVVLSFEAWSPLKSAVFIGLDNYQEMFTDDDVFWQALWNTLGIIASAPVGIVAALGLALLVNSNIRGAMKIAHLPHTESRWIRTHRLSPLCRRHSVFHRSESQSRNSEESGVRYSGPA